MGEELQRFQCETTTEQTKEEIYMNLSHFSIIFLYIFPHLFRSFVPSLSLYIPFASQSACMSVCMYFCLSIYRPMYGVRVYEYLTCLSVCLL